MKSGSKLKCLNLYSGLGGNRFLWGHDVEVTAVEINENAANYYSKHFPQDELVIGDAHNYLIEHYKDFDFIWSSPPCPSHSRARMWANHEPIYADMNLYQEIILLQHFFEGKWCVENVIPYYDLMIPAQQFSRHMFWMNDLIAPMQISAEISSPDDLSSRVAAWLGMPYESVEIKGRTDTAWRNCVHPELGQHILRELTTKTDLFGSVSL